MKVLLAIGVVVVALSLSGNLAQAGENGVIRIGSYTADVGDEVTVVLEAVDIPPPGLDAWAFDIVYDPSIVTASSCESLQGGGCNPALRENTARATGAYLGEGLTGTFPLATYAFACDAVGTLKLEVEEVLFTTAEPQLEIGDLLLDDGSITCTEPPDLITISSLELQVGEQGTVVVEAERVAQPGVGYWGFELLFDAQLVRIVGCEALGDRTRCSGDPFQSEVEGSSATGLESSTRLANFEFQCRRPGESEVGTFVSVWSVARVGLEERLVEVEPGRISCSASQLPAAGTGPVDSGTADARVLALVLAGAALIASAVGLRRRV